MVVVFLSRNNLWPFFTQKIPDTETEEEDYHYSDNEMPEEEHEVETPCDHGNPSSHYVWSSCGMESDDCGESEHGDNDWSTKENTATDSHTEDEIDDNTSNHVKWVKQNSPYILIITITYF